jgi:cell division protein FtsB
MTKKTANEYIASIPKDQRGPLDLERQIDELVLENKKLRRQISELEGQVQSARNDADNQRAFANIPQY